MVDAGVTARIATLLAANDRAPVGAAVYPCCKIPLRRPRHDDRRVPNERALEVSRIGQLSLKRQIAPGRTTKDALLLEVVDFPRAVHVEWNGCVRQVLQIGGHGSTTERRVGKECVSTLRSGGSSYN